MLLSSNRVTPRKLTDIRGVATNVASVLFPDFPVRNVSFAQLLDRLSVEYNLNYEVLSEGDMPCKVEACCDPSKDHILIRSDVFVALCEENPRARFTIAHELGHILLEHKKLYNREASGSGIKPYEDSEWQANQFAAELLMPLDVIKQKKLKAAWQIVDEFNVSPPAAENRIKQLRGRNEI